jgi:hypothetical protein
MWVVGSVTALNACFNFAVIFRHPAFAAGGALSRTADPSKNMSTGEEIVAEASLRAAAAADRAHGGDGSGMALAGVAAKATLASGGSAPTASALIASSRSARVALARTNTVEVRVGAEGADGASALSASSYDVPAGRQAQQADMRSEAEANPYGPRSSAGNAAEAQVSAAHNPFTGRTELPPPLPAARPLGRPAASSSAGPADVVAANSFFPGLGGIGARGRAQTSPSHATAPAPPAVSRAVVVNPYAAAIAANQAAEEEEGENPFL